MNPELNRAIDAAAAAAENYFWMKLQGSFSDSMRGRMELDPQWGEQMRQITRAWVARNTRLLDPAAGAAMAATAGGGNA